MKNNTNTIGKLYKALENLERKKHLSNYARIKQMLQKELFNTL